MKKIFKYPIDLIDKQTIFMPKGAVILTVQIQMNRACIWSMVEPDKPNEKRVIRVIGTGHEIQDRNLKYIGTIQQFDGELILHVFEAISD